MNKRLIMLLIILAALAASIFLQSQPGPSPQTVVHQHEVYPPEPVATTGFDMYGNLTTHLPIVILQTNGQQIPGADAPTEEVLLCSYAIVDNPDGLNHSQDTPTQSGTMAIKIRGNSSRLYSKKQYTLKLVKPDGASEKSSLLGMPAESVWVLNGSNIDHSMIRNYMLYNISGEIMSYAPRNRLCEVMMETSDGDLEYQGVYSLIEKPKVSEVRLNLTKNDPRFAETSFLLQMNARTDNLKIDHLNPEETIIVYPLDLEYPDPNVLTEESKRYIENQLLSFEKLLYDASYLDSWGHVWDAVDQESFVDYFIINEFFQNYDAGIRSTYLYKDLGGKMCIGPVWDFDGAFNNFDLYDMQIDWLDMQTTYYYTYFTQSPDFGEACVRRYRALRKTFLSESYLIDYIDSCSDYLGSAALRNCDKWYSGDYALYYEDLEKMKTFVKERGAWMDENFADRITVVG